MPARFVLDAVAITLIASSASAAAALTAIKAVDLVASTVVEASADAETTIEKSTVAEAT